MLPSSKSCDRNTVTKKNKVCTGGRFWRRTPDKKQQKGVPENVNICEPPDPHTIWKELSVEFAAALISFQSPGIWRGTAGRNAILYFFLFSDERLPSPLGCTPAFCFYRHGSTRKQFYWNQGIFMQSNSFTAFGTWSSQVSSPSCHSIPSRTASSLQPRSRSGSTRNPQHGANSTRLRTQQPQLCKRFHVFQPEWTLPTWIPDNGIWRNPYRNTTLHRLWWKQWHLGWKPTSI